MAINFPHPNLPEDFLERANSQRVNRLLHEMQCFGTADAVEPHRVIRGYEIAGIAVRDAKGEVNVSISDRGLAREDVKLTVEQPTAK